MAQRRMFSKEITNSSDFQMMSPSAQALYLHIGMNSDDDGFCEVFTIVRMTESKPDDLRALHERGFVYLVDMKVGIVKDWHTNNDIRSDRYTQSKYLGDPKYGDVYKIIMKDKVQNLVRYKTLMTSGITPGITSGTTQDRIGKVSIGKDTNTPTPAKLEFSLFWDLYPNKTMKKKSGEKWNKLSIEVQKIILEDLPKRILGEKWSKNNGQFVEMPTTYLNGERWNDEIVTPTAPAQTKTLRV